MTFRDDVLAIQAIVGVTADGQFGPASAVATRARLEATGKPASEGQGESAAPIAGEAAAAALRVSQAGLDLIKEFEGLHKKRPDGRIEAYPDPGSGGDPWTIGFGSTGADIRKGTIWTLSQCEARFKEHVEEFADHVRRFVKGFPTSQNQFDALVSFAYNLGPNALSGSTLLKRHMAGEFAEAADQFLRWNQAAGRVMPGLTRRRAAERKMYLGEG